MNCLIVARDCYHKHHDELTSDQKRYCLELIALATVEYESVERSKKEK